MNNEDQFEQRLRRQPLRQVPPAWREEILAAAEANRRNATTQSVSEDQAALFAGWRLLFARLPVAWAALAALWVALIGANLMMPSPIVSVAVQTPPSARMESLAALDFGSADFEALGKQLSPAPATSPATETPTAPRRPHSERRRDADVGETHPKRWFDTIA
jgi:hypothetical protein